MTPLSVVRALARRARARWRYGRDWSRFRVLWRGAEPRFPLRREDRWPCLGEATASTEFDRHYVYHPAWAARVLARTRPAWHVDVGSTLHFAAIVSAFVPVRFYDYRPADLSLEGLTSRHADLARLPFADGEVPSLSCMHVLEHVGLGRYGDPLDPDGDRRAAAELARALAPGGNLLVVVPTGRPRICFNAHRIYSTGQLRALFPGLALREFALVPDRPEEGGLLPGAPCEVADRQTYACGCYWFVKGEA